MKEPMRSANMPDTKCTSAPFSSSGTDGLRVSASTVRGGHTTSDRPSTTEKEEEEEVL
jgi:hypothetical protein